MSAQIGRYTMHSMTGRIPSWGQQVQPHQRDGVDGTTYVLLGKRSPQFTVETVRFVDDLDDAIDLANQYEALRGTFQTIEDTAGREFRKVMILDVTPDPRPIVRDTANNNAMVRASWTLQRGA